MKNVSHWKVSWDNKKWASADRPCLKKNHLEKRTLYAQTQTQAGSDVLYVVASNRSFKAFVDNTLVYTYKNDPHHDGRPHHIIQLPKDTPQTVFFEINLSSVPLHYTSGLCYPIKEGQYKDAIRSIFESNFGLYLLWIFIMSLVAVTLIASAVMRRLQPYFSFCVMSTFFSSWVMTSNIGPSSLRLFFDSKTLGYVEFLTLCFVPYVVLNFYRLAVSRASGTRLRALVTVELFSFVSGSMFAGAFLLKFRHVYELVAWLNSTTIAIMLLFLFADSGFQGYCFLKDKLQDPLEKAALLCWCLCFFMTALIGFHDVFVTLKIISWRFDKSIYSLVSLVASSFLVMCHASWRHLIRVNQNTVELQSVNYLNQEKERVLHDLAFPIKALERRLRLFLNQNKTLIPSDKSTMIDLLNHGMQAFNSTLKESKDLSDREMPTFFCVYDILEESVECVKCELSWVDNSRLKVRINGSRSVHLYGLKHGMTRVFENLAKNALESQKDSFHQILVVHLEKRKDGSLKILFKNPGALKESALTRINASEKVFSSKVQGRQGVGLSIVYDVLNRQKGSLKAYNDVQKKKPWVNMEIIL